MESKSSTYPNRYNHEAMDYNTLTKFPNTGMPFRQFSSIRSFNNFNENLFPDFYKSGFFHGSFSPGYSSEYSEIEENSGHPNGFLELSDGFHTHTHYQSDYPYAPFYPAYEEDIEKEFHEHYSSIPDLESEIRAQRDPESFSEVLSESDSATFSGQMKKLELKVSAAEFNPELLNQNWKGFTESRQDIEKKLKYTENQPKNNENYSKINKNESKTKESDSKTTENHLKNNEIEPKAKRNDFMIQNMHKKFKSSSNSLENPEKDEKDIYSSIMIEEIEIFFENKKQLVLESAQTRIKQIELESKNEIELLTKEKEDLISKILQKTNEVKVSSSFEAPKNNIFLPSSKQNLSVFSENSLKPKKDPIKVSLETIRKNFFFLLNSSEKSAFYSNNLLNTINLVIPNWTPGLSILPVNPFTILVNPGNSQEVQKFDIYTKQKQSLPLLPVSRKFAGFTFINNHPALIGGMLANESAPSNTVEIFKENIWEAGPSLNRPRYSPECLVFQEKTFIFGGLPIEVNDLIEVCDGDKWSIIQPKLPEKVLKFGVTSYKDQILIVGGKILGENDKRRLGIWHFNPDTSTNLSKVDNLKVSFISNNPASSVAIQGKLFFLDSEREKVMEIPLDVSTEG